MSAPRPERLILAVPDVLGFTRACQTHDDLEVFVQLRKYYALVARAVEPAGGWVVKCIGDAVLVAFPAHERAAAVARLRALRDEASALWRGFDERCSVEVKMGIGEVAVGPLGAPGDERTDTIGAALNTLFRARAADYGVDGELRELPRVFPL
jgi:class 3 adenylate cyclase